MPPLRLESSLLPLTGCGSAPVTLMLAGLSRAPSPEPLARYITPPQCYNTAQSAVTTAHVTLVTAKGHSLRQRFPSPSRFHSDIPCSQPAHAVAALSAVWSIADDADSWVPSLSQIGPESLTRPPYPRVECRFRGLDSLVFSRRARPRESLRNGHHASRGPRLFPLAVKSSLCVLW
jgi:hypothetical protein